VSATILIYLVIIAVPGMFLISGGSPGGISWPTLAWVLALGLVATEPIGAILGSLVRTARGVGYVSLPVLGLTAISGIFYPVTVFPAWLRWIAEVFPVYWLGLGMRSAFLPASAAALEVGGSWRHLDTALVLGGWAVAGLLIAPLVLRRMARRASGSRLAVGTRR